MKININKYIYINGIYISILIIAVQLFIGCSSTPKLVKFKINNLADEVIISKELNTVLNAKTKPTVVIRVPVTTTTVTTKEREGRLTEVYNQMEKSLVKAGFTVRDRGLLNNLLANTSTSSQADYEEIGRKIQTDLIIEIMDIEFDKESFEYLDSAYSVNEKKMIQLKPKPWFKLVRGKMQAKVVIVSKGQNGGYLTFNYTPCVEGCEDFYEVKDERAVFRNLRDSDTQVFEYFSMQLIKALNNTLLAK